MTAPLKLHKQTPVRGNRRLIPAQGVLAGSGGVCGGENQGGMRSLGRQCVCFLLWVSTGSQKLMWESPEKKELRKMNVDKEEVLIQLEYRL